MTPDKRSILITGCSSGIGYCAAHGLQARGYQVVASARREADVDSPSRRSSLDTFAPPVTSTSSTVTLSGAIARLAR